MRDLRSITPRLRREHVPSSAQSARRRLRRLLASGIGCVVLSSACGGTSRQEASGPSTTSKSTCLAEVVASLDLTIDAAATGNNGAYSQAANEVATTLGIRSAEYQIWLRLNPTAVQDTYQVGKAQAKSNARTSAARECSMVSSASNSASPTTESAGGDESAFTVSQEALDFLTTDIEAHADDKRAEVDQSIESVRCDLQAGARVDLGRTFKCVGVGKQGGVASVEVVVTGGSRPSTFFDWSVARWSPKPEKPR